jgi:NADPH:quinone reductase-like Zn-dependent oxidoreductase
MKAIIYSQYGKADVLKLAEVEPPVLKPNTVVVKNYASSVNPIDWKIRSGLLRPLSGIKPPIRCGSDFAGEIVQLGLGASRFKVGDRVYGFVSPIKGGAYAQQLCVPEKQLAMMPELLNYADAGVIPLAGLTAYTVLKKIAALKPNDRIVINGCSGGVGVMAIQLAKVLGAYVIGICSDKNHQLALSLGVDEIVDYQRNPDLKGIEKIDVFFDVVSNRTPAKIKNLLTADGIYVNTLPRLPALVGNVLVNLFARQKSYTVLVKPSGLLLADLNQWLVTGQLKAVIEKSYLLSDMVSAQQHSEAGHVCGKLAVRIDSV